MTIAVRYHLLIFLVSALSVHVVHGIIVTNHTELVNCMATDAPSVVCEIPADTVIVSEGSYTFSKETLIRGNDGSVIDLNYMYRFGVVTQNVTFLDLEVRNGFSGMGGGAFLVVNSLGSTNLTNVFVSNMYAVGGYGGAFYGQDALGTFQNVTFFNCTDQTGVGAFFVQDLTWRFEDVTFRNCTPGTSGSRAAVLAFTTWNLIGCKVVFAGDIQFINSGIVDTPVITAFTDSTPPRTVRTADIILSSDPEKPAHFYFENNVNLLFEFQGFNPDATITFEAESLVVSSHSKRSTSPAIFKTSGNIDNMSITVHQGIFANNIGLIFASNSTTINVPNGPIHISNSAANQQISVSYGTLVVSATELAVKQSSNPIYASGQGSIVIDVIGIIEIAQAIGSALISSSSYPIRLTASQFIVRDSNPAPSLFRILTPSAVINITSTCSSGSCISSSGAPSPPTSPDPVAFSPAEVGIYFSGIRGPILNVQPFLNLALHSPNSAIVFEGNNANSGGALRLNSANTVLSLVANALLFANNTAKYGGAIYADPAFANIFENVLDVQFFNNSASDSGCAIAFSSGCPSLANSDAISFSNNSYSSSSYVPTECTELDGVCFDPFAPVNPPTSPMAPPTSPMAPPTSPMAPPTSPMAPPTSPMAPPTSPMAPPTSPMAPSTNPPLPSPPSPPTPPPSGCSGAPPASSATCQGGTWIVLADDFIATYAPPPTSNNSAPIAPPPPSIESPVIIIGNATVPRISIVIHSVSLASASTATASFISSNSCISIGQIDIGLDSDAVASIEAKPSRVNLVSSGCPIQTVLVVEASKPKRSCSKFDHEEIRTSHTLAASFQVSSSRCNLWWIILISVLGGITLLCLAFLLIYRASPKARKRIQPYFSSNA